MAQAARGRRLAVGTCARSRRAGSRRLLGAIVRRLAREMGAAPHVERREDRCHARLRQSGARAPCSGWVIARRRHVTAPRGLPPQSRSSRRARSAFCRVSSPTRRPSEVVTGRLVSFCLCIRSTTSRRRALGRIVLGPCVIACSAKTSSRPRIARRPSRPRTTRRSSTTKQVSQPLSSRRPHTSRS